MINKNWNINILLCGYCDEKVENINNIFDKLNVDDNNKAAFNIVTIMSAIGCDEQRFGLYYFIENLEKGQIAFIGSSLHERMSELDAKEKETLASSIAGSTRKTNRMEIAECEFPGLGNYEIRVYKFDNDEAKEVQGDNETKAIEFANEEHLVATYSFVVGRK